MFCQKQILLVVCLLLFASGFSYAQTTHMGVPENDMLTLHTACEKLSCLVSKNSFSLWFRTPSDGTNDGNPFVIPEGQVLVVTDLDWRFEHPDAKELDGTQIVLQFGRINLANQSQNLVAVSQGTFHANPTSSFFPKTGSSSGNIQMTSGFVVHSGASPLALFSPDLGSAGRIDIFLRGYLIPECLPGTNC